MNKSPFDSLPKLSQLEAITILKTPLENLERSSDYYKAAFHLSKYPGKESEEALITLLESDLMDDSIRLAKRKAIDSLVKLKCNRSLSLIEKFLWSDDIYLVESAAWAAMELGSDKENVVSRLSTLLFDTNQNRRMLVQSLSRLGGNYGLAAIKILLNSSSLDVGVKGACMAAMSRVKHDHKYYPELRKHLFLPNQNDRHCAVQDVIDAKAFELLPDAIRSPISPSFRLRAVESLVPDDSHNSNINLLSNFDRIILDDPRQIYLGDTSIEDYSFDQIFSTDFRVAYRALNYLIVQEAEDIWDAFLPYKKRLELDYGAMYFAMILFRMVSGWNDSAMEYIKDLAFNCLSDYWPNNMKFRPAAIIFLMSLDPYIYINSLEKWLDEESNPYWVTRYAVLLGSQLNPNDSTSILIRNKLTTINSDSNRFVRLKVLSIIDNSNS